MSSVIEDAKKEFVDMDQDPWPGAPELPLASQIRRVLCQRLTRCKIRMRPLAAKTQIDG